MTDQLQFKQTDRADVVQNGIHVVADDVAYIRCTMVNVIFLGDPKGGDWCLVDTGLGISAGHILRAVETRFGKGAKPACILLTHGHFDHVGALVELLAIWDVPVYAHPLELPYLNGEAAYPPPDPKVGGGLMSFLSPLYPRGPIRVGPRLEPLPEDHCVPGFPEWSWVWTPGHSAGHVSFWRAKDSLLVAGDVFITTDQHSAYSVLTQEAEMHGPPAYFTTDWEAAHRSVEKVALLNPWTAITGHGHAMRGVGLRRNLIALAHLFTSVAQPTKGYYVHHPQMNRLGEAYRNPGTGKGMAMADGEQARPSDTP